MGRKKNPESIRNLEQINIKLPKGLRDKVKIDAAIEGMYISDYFKEMILYFYAKK